MKQLFLNMNVKGVRDMNIDYRIRSVDGYTKNIGN